MGSLGIQSSREAYLSVDGGFLAHALQAAGPALLRTRDTGGVEARTGSEK